MQERRSERRIAITLPVIVRGKDSHGVSFVAATETREISLSGASLSWPHGIIVEPDTRLEIQCGEEKSQYQIAWVARNGASGAGRFGVQCLEPGKYIWGVDPKELGAEGDDSAEAFLPDGVTARAEVVEAIVRVLFRKGVMTRAEVSEELEKLKTAKV